MYISKGSFISFKFPSTGISLCIIKLDIFVVIVLNTLLHVRCLCDFSLHIPYEKMMKVINWKITLNLHNLTDPRSFPASVVMSVLKTDVNKLYLSESTHFLPSITESWLLRTTQRKEMWTVLNKCYLILLRLCSGC